MFIWQQNNKPKQTTRTSWQANKQASKRKQQILSTCLISELNQWTKRVSEREKKKKKKKETTHTQTRTRIYIVTNFCFHILSSPFFFYFSCLFLSNPSLYCVCVCACFSKLLSFRSHALLLFFFLFCFVLFYSLFY